MNLGVWRSSRSSSVNVALASLPSRFMPHVAAAVGFEVDGGLFDRLVGAGVDRDAGAFDRADVAEAVDAAVGEAGVVGVVVVDPFDGDRRRGDDGDGVFERAGVAGFDAIAQVLRDAAWFAGEWPAESGR